MDRLGWAAGSAHECRGVRIGFRTQDVAFLAALQARLPPGFRPARSRRVGRLYSVVHAARGDGRLRRFHLLYADGALLARTLDESVLLDALQGDVRRHYAEHARERVFVHAGAVAWEGRAILVPGKSFSGKSRLVAALVQAGATYYSDEYAVLDRHGRVHPFPAPLSLRPSPDDFTAPTPERLHPGRRPVPVGLVVVTEYRKGCLRPRLVRLSAGRGVLALMAHTVPARSRPAEALAALTRAATGATVVRGVRGEAEECAAVLLRTVEAA